jgi:hypothetical protein
MSPNIPWIWHWWIYNFLLNSAHLGKVWTDVCSMASSTFQCWIILFFCRFFLKKKETTPEYSKRSFIFLHKIFLFEKNKVYRNFNISEINIMSAKLAVVLSTYLLFTSDTGMPLDWVQYMRWSTHSLGVVHARLDALR